MGGEKQESRVISQTVKRPRPNYPNNVEAIQAIKFNESMGCCFEQDREHAKASGRMVMNRGSASSGG